MQCFSNVLNHALSQRLKDFEIGPPHPQGNNQPSSEKKVQYLDILISRKIFKLFPYVQHFRALGSLFLLSISCFPEVGNIKTLIRIQKLQNAYGLLPTLGNAAVLYPYLCIWLLFFIYVLIWLTLSSYFPSSKKIISHDKAQKPPGCLPSCASFLWVHLFSWGSVVITYFIFPPEVQEVVEVNTDPSSHTGNYGDYGIWC